MGSGVSLLQLPFDRYIFSQRYLSPSEAVKLPLNIIRTAIISDYYAKGKAFTSER